MADAYLMNHKRKVNEESKYYDKLTSIGASETLAGAIYEKAGYFGRVPASQLFTGSELSSAVGITVGTLQNSDVDWLKFYCDGKILFRPMKAIRCAISWNDINNAGCVFGTKTVTKNGITFKVRLMKGASVDPANVSQTTTNTMKYSEWTRLMLPISEKSATNSWLYPISVEPSIPNWNIGFTDAELLLNTSAGYGSLVWCQETSNSNTVTKLARGRFDGSYGGGFDASNKQLLNGWCPVLEVV